MPGPRELTITATNGAFSPASVSAVISVQPINNNPPVLRFGGRNEVVYAETHGASAVLPVGALMQPLISDPDNNAIFSIHKAVVSLAGVIDGISERLNYSSMLPSGVAATGKHSF